MADHGVVLADTSSILRLKRPRILIFDEATSHLDASTSEQFAQTVNRIKGRVTVLFIAHQMPKGLSVDATFQLG